MAAYKYPREVESVEERSDSSLEFLTTVSGKIKRHEFTSEDTPFDCGSPVVSMWLANTYMNEPR